MELYEFQGKTAEEAIENACRQLNLTRDGMEIEIIEPGSAGIFGLVGGRKAKIKVSIQKKKSPLRKNRRKKTNGQPKLNLNPYLP